MRAYIEKKNGRYRVVFNSRFCGPFVTDRSYDNKEWAAMELLNYKRAIEELKIEIFRGLYSVAEIKMFVAKKCAGIENDEYRKLKEHELGILGREIRETMINRAIKSTGKKFQFKICLVWNGKRII